MLHFNKTKTKSVSTVLNELDQLLEQTEKFIETGAIYSNESLLDHPEIQKHFDFFMDELAICAERYLEVAIDAATQQVEDQETKEEKDHQRSETANFQNLSGVKTARLPAMKQHDDTPVIIPTMSEIFQRAHNNG